MTTTGTLGKVAVVCSTIFTTCLLYSAVSVWSSLRSEQLAFEDAKELVLIGDCAAGTQQPLRSNYGAFLTLQSGSKPFLRDVGLVDDSSKLDTFAVAAGQQIYAREVRISPDVLSLLGARYVVGFGLGGLEDPETAVLLSEQYWTEHFGRNPDILGERLKLGDRTLDVAGVVDADFRLSIEHDAGLVDRADVWTVLPRTTHPTLTGFRLIGRLNQGFSPGVAEEQLQPLWEGRDVCVRSLVKSSEFDELRDQAVKGMALGLALLVLCGLLSLMMTASTILQDAANIRIRLMLGARPAAIAARYSRRIASWTAVASLAASFGVGLLLKTLDLSVIGAMTEIMLRADVGSAVAVAMILALVSLALGFIVARGLCGVLQRDLQGRAGQHYLVVKLWRIGPWFVAPLLSMAMVLTVALIVGSPITVSEAGGRVAHIDLDQTFYAHLTLTPLRAEDFETLVETLSANPMIRQAAVSAGAPFVPMTYSVPVNSTGLRIARTLPIAGDYFGALGLNHSVAPPQTGEVLISEAARRDRGGVAQTSDQAWSHGDTTYQVVGEVPALPGGLGSYSEPLAYTELEGHLPHNPLLIVRSDAALAAVRDMIVPIVSRVMPGAVVKRLVSAGRLERESQRERRLVFLTLFIVWGLCVAAALGGVALVIAIHATASHKALAIRVALGCRPRDLRRVLLKGLLVPVALGIVGGGFGAVLAARLGRALLTSVEHVNPAVVVPIGAALILIVYLVAELSLTVATRRLRGSGLARSLGAEQ